MAANSKTKNTQRSAARRDQTPDEVIASLRHEVRDLKATVAKLQKEAESKTAATNSKTKSAGSSWSWRGLVVWFSLALATVLLIAGNIFFWVGTTIVNTDRYVSVVGPLLEQPPIQTAVAQYTTQQLFNSVDVQQVVEQVLPPRADFLAPQLTGQLMTHTQSSLESVLGSPQFQDYWYASLTKTHSALITYSKTYEGNGTLQVSDVFSQLSKQLADTKLSFLSRATLPEKVGSINITTVGWLPVLHKISTRLGIFKAVTLFFLFTFSALAIWLSGRRRRIVILLFSFFAAGMIVSLVAVKVTGGLVASHANPTYKLAIQTAYDTVFHGFIVQTLWICVLSLLIVAVAWMSGPYRPAVRIRRQTSKTYTDLRRRFQRA